MKVMKVLLIVLAVLAALCILGFAGLYCVYYYDLDAALIAKMEAKAKAADVK